jgi:Flp pilus assembly protein protease CpaA
VTIIIEYFLPLILLFGLITSYEDIYQGKIRNRYILIALIIGLLIYISYSLYIIYYSNLELNWIYLVETLTNSMIALILGFILWIMSFWSAGDAKLFFTYSFIIPISIYSIDKIPFFSSFYLIFNSFIPFLIFAIVLTIREKVTDVRYGDIKEEITIKKIARNAVYTFTITWIANYVISLFNIKSNMLSIIITSSLLIYIVRKYIYENIPEMMGRIKIRTIIFAISAIAISAFRIYLNYDNILTINFIWTFLIYYIILSAIRGYVKSETKSFFTKKVHVLHLWEGMHLADTIIKKEKKKNEDCKKENLKCDKNIINCDSEYENCKKEIYIIAKKDDIQTKLNAAFPNELSNEDVKRIIKLYKQNKLNFNKLNIHKTMPFAPLMFIGALLTIIAKGAFTNLI